MKYSLIEIARITDSQFLGRNVGVTSVVTDSRGMADGEQALFVALHGQHHDGHRFIPEMYERGIRAFMVSTLPESERYPDAGFVLCRDTLEGLQTLAAHHRNLFGGVVAAITGSNGKTVVKEWIAQLCTEKIKLFRSPRSYNSQLGVPLSILMIKGDEDIALIEAGISEPGEMDKLGRIIRPDIGILTNIGQAHLENFSDREELLAEKLRLFETAKKIVFFADDPSTDRSVRNKYPDREYFTIGSDMTILSDKDRYGRIKFMSGDKSYNFQLPFTDTVSIRNATEALAFWLAVGCDPNEVIPKITRLAPVAMRMELKEGIGGGKLINDSYNSDIESLAQSLNYLASVAGEQEKVLIISDILQSGMENTRLYGEVSRLTTINGISKVIGIGPEISRNAEHFGEKTCFYPNVDTFIASFDRNELSGKSVLIKGSRSFRLEKISELLEKQIHTTILEIDLDAMMANLNHYRRKIGAGTGIMAMAKAFSYGSGSHEVAALLQHQRIDYLAVAFADEGVALRQAGITVPIVVLNADPYSFRSMIEYRLEPEIYNFLSLKMFQKELRLQGEPGYPIHVSLDTGMHRLGFVPEEIDRLIYMVKTDPSVRIRSVFTHFSASENPAEDDFTREQIECFSAMSDRIIAAFPEWKILRHTSNSGGIERFAEGHFELVRLGIGLYGFSPTNEKLQNVSTLKSRIMQIKHLTAGETVGYGRAGKITRDTVVATVPIGYADGIDRRLGKGNWSFIVNGRQAPVIGNICMDTTMIDITGIVAEEGDEAIVFGAGHDAADMAKVLKTIPYEVLTSISPRVKRVYTKE